MFSDTDIVTLVVSLPWVLRKLKNVDRGGFEGDVLILMLVVNGRSWQMKWHRQLGMMGGDCWNWVMEEVYICVVC